MRRSKFFFWAFSILALFAAFAAGTMWQTGGQESGLVTELAVAVLVFGLACWHGGMFDEEVDDKVKMNQFGVPLPNAFDRKMQEEANRVATIFTADVRRFSSGPSFGLIHDAYRAGFIDAGTFARRLLKGRDSK